MQKRDFNRGWTYFRQGFAQPQPVTLPHDAMIHEKRHPNNPSGSAGAFFPGGVYEYKKRFAVPAEWVEKTVTFQFEGVYKNSTVFMNDYKIGGCAYGYSQFSVLADGVLRYGQENIIRVVVDNNDHPNSRWYTGSGIYRPVWMLVAGKHHIDVDGVKIMTISYCPATIRVATAHTGGDSVHIDIMENGKIVAHGEGDVVDLEIPDARLWSDTEPALYQCRVTLLEQGIAIDERTETFGIRLIEWSPKGLFVNGKQTLLRGGCVHHSNGILGACSYAKAEERRVRLLKEAGYNALRSAHNPASVALLDACDRLGMYVIDETWDMWYRHKSAHDYASDFAANYACDLTSLVDRDFNHPSVIMYSIGNEVSEPAARKGQDLTRELVSSFHALDSTRPVTGGFNLMIIDMAARGKGIYKDGGGRNDDNMARVFNGMNSTLFNMITSRVGTKMNKAANSRRADAVTTPCLDALDIAGYNYASGRYPLEGKAHPNRVVFGAETFPQDIVKNWRMVRRYSYLIGDFMWTAWDYLGENGLGAWAYTPDGRGFEKPYPWLLADCGALDLLGNPTGEVFLAQAAWGLLNKPAIAVQPVNHPGVKPAKAAWRGTNAIPSWSWKQCEGHQAVVEVYTDAREVELRLNARRIGRKRVKNCLATFNVRYAPGTLEAVTFDDSSQELARSRLISASGPISIRVIPEDLALAVGDIAYIQVELVGENGVVECNADSRLEVAVEGGELLAFGSANPRTEENYHDGNFTTYYGKAQAVVRAEKAGIVRISVCGNGLEPAVAEMTVTDEDCSL